MLTSIGIVLHLQSSGSGLMPFSIQGWYKYPAVTKVTCPIEVSVPVMCSLPSVRVYRCPSSLRRAPAASVPSGCPLSLSCHDVTCCPRCHHVASAVIPLGPPGMPCQSLGGGTLPRHCLLGWPDGSGNPADGRQWPRVAAGERRIGGVEGFSMPGKGFR